MKHELNVDEKLFEILYELEDIEDIEDINEMNNMIDISVEGNQTFLLKNGILSHNSAANSISKLLGRDGKGYYAMFGVPPNAYSADISKIAKSVKMTDLKDILGLQYTKTEQNNINFKDIIITTDFDLPGHFIGGQLIGMLYRFGRNLFEEGRIKRLVTPLMVVTDKKETIIDWFYSFSEYEKFQEKHKSKNYLYDYKKGLGSWSADELETVISKEGLENMLETYVLDEESEKYIEGWLGNDAQHRKDFLTDVKFDIDSI